MTRVACACAWLAIGAIAAQPAAADRFEISLLGGGRERWSTYSNRSLAGASYGGVLEYVPIPGLGVAFSAIHTSYAAQQSYVTREVISETEFALTARGYLAPDARVVPYLVWGLAGHASRERTVYYGIYDYGSVTEVNVNLMTWGVQVGAGFTAPLRGAIRCGIEGQLHMSPLGDSGAAEAACFARITVPLFAR